jgi:hypothetical protein
MPAWPETAVTTTWWRAPGDVVAVASIRLGRSSRLRRRAGQEGVRVAVVALGRWLLERVRRKPSPVRGTLGSVAATLAVNAVVTSREELTGAVRRLGDDEQHFSLDARRTAAALACPTSSELVWPLLCEPSAASSLPHP